MQILTFTHKLLIITGCWLPDSWISLYKRIAYYVYSATLIILMHTFMLSQLIDLVTVVNNPDEFSDNFCIFLPISISCCKQLSLLVNHKHIVTMIDILMGKQSKPLEPNEMIIQHKYDKDIQNKVFGFFCLGILTCTCIAYTSSATNFRNRKLTYRAWLPFDYTSRTTIFCLVYIHQLAGLFLGAALNIACDGLICGLLFHICSQVDILIHRLRNITFYKDTIRNCVIQHCLLYRMAFIVNSKFRILLTIQLLMSTLVVCFSLYMLTKATNNSGYIEKIMYISCALTQIFLLCWYGNEVKLKSRQMLDDIFEMEWLTLDESVKKSLIIIMERAMIPIEITSGYVISMNLDSFMGILKTSYSAYNLLQQVQ